MLSCQEATKLLSESLDSPLPLVQRLRLSMHVLACSACRRFREQMLHLQGIGAAYSGRVDTGPADAGLSEEARARIQRALEDEAEGRTP